MTDKPASKSLHIIIAINPMVDIYLPDLIDQFAGEDFRIIEFYPRRILRSYTGSEISRYIHPTRREYFRNLKKCIREIESRGLLYETVNLYFAHVFHALTNYFFFAGKKNYRFHLIPDGIANYYQVTTRSFFLKLLLKKITSLVTGIRFTVYSGHLTGIHFERYQTHYALDERGLITGNTPVVKINLSWQKKPARPDHRQILILGQSFSRYRTYRRIYRAIFEYVRSNFTSEYRLFYKAHPNEKVSPDFRELLRHFDIVVISDDPPVEYLAGAYEIIVSEVSSALSNIKIIYGDKITCIGFIEVPDKKIWNRYRRSRLSEMKAHLLRTGVRVVGL